MEPDIFDTLSLTYIIQELDCIFLFLRELCKNKQCKKNIEGQQNTGVKNDITIQNCQTLLEMLVITFHQSF